ncbi:scaffold attachment factor B1-like isoform X1 [Anolis sagrei]|uniref:scaffold attachment factor B1-like isoform X1 n=1 Tax=Anolis sagrei TaxID=38937 RepID=UPI00351FCA03
MAESAATAAPGVEGEEASSPSSSSSRRLAELRVIDLRAELKRRSLDTAGNKSVLLERLRNAIEEEGGNPDEIPVASESTPKRTPKRTVKGRKPEEECGDDNGLEENSRDEQEDIEASSENLQEMDMGDMSVLEEAEIDNSSAVDGGDDYSSENILDSDKDNIDVEMKELPEQLMESEENGDELDDQLETAAPDLATVKDLEEQRSEPENEKMLDILGDTCKSEPLNEDPPEAEQEAHEPLPVGQEEEEEALGGTTARPDEERLDSEGKKKKEEDQEEEKEEEEEESKALVVAKGELSGESVKETTVDSDSLALASRSEGGGDESSRGAQTLEASSEETAEEEKETETRPQGGSPEEAVKTEAQAQGQEEEQEEQEEESSATKEPSAQEGGDLNMSSEETRESTLASKEERGRSASSSSSASSGRNFWVSGLASTTRATDLKNLFSKYGKVVGAKVVTNARSPGLRCYGFVTMSTSEEASKCITHCHKTELHGKIISIEKAKNEPATKKLLDKKDGDAKEDASPGERSASIKKSEKDDADKSEEKEKEDSKSGSTDPSKTGKSGNKGTERTVIMDKSKGEPVISVKTTSRSKERSAKSQDRKSESREKSRERQGSVPFNRTREKRSSEEPHRSSRDRRDRQQRLQAIWEQEERERLEIARDKLEFERVRLERERSERERLERERMRIERERRREQERIQREREELRRQHDQLRYEQERRVAVRRPYDIDGRREDAYWPEAKRMAMDYRHRSDFSRQYRFHDVDYRREGSRGMMGDRDIPHYTDERHRDSRDGWSSYGSDRRVSEGRDGRDWGDRKFEDRSWQSGSDDGGSLGRDPERWRGRGRGRRARVSYRGRMSGRGGFLPSDPSGPSSPRGETRGEGFSAQDRGDRPSDPRFSRRY